MDKLISALLPTAWQETYETTLNAPDSMPLVNNDFMQHQQKKTVGQIDQKKTNQMTKKCTNWGKLHTGICRKKPRVPGTCSQCKTKNISEGKIKSHPDSECWDLHPEKIPAHLKEKLAAAKKAEEEGTTDFTIINECRC